MFRRLDIQRLERANGVSNWAIVLGRATAADLNVAELAFDHPKRVFCLGADACLGLFTILLGSLPIGVYGSAQRMPVRMASCH